MLKVPLIPLKKNHKTQVLFLFMMTVIYALNMLIIFPTMDPKTAQYCQWTNDGTFILVFVTFLFASFKNPGHIKPDPNQNFISLLREINPADLCPECKVIRSARSRHCAICNQCVERFDHHCPWINNCVGIKNHNTFMMFLVSIWFKIIFHAYFDT